MSVPSAVATTVASRPTSSDVMMASWIPSTAFQLDPVVEREPLPDVVEPARGLVEREEDHDGDREHQVADGEERVHGQRMALHERSTHAPRDRGRARGGDAATVVIR